MGTRHSQSVSDLGSSLDEDTAEALTDGYTMLQENLPTLKNHVKTVLDKVPGIHETIQDGIDSTPDRETIKSLPTKDFVKDQVKSVADTIPSTDYVHEKID